MQIITSKKTKCYINDTDVFSGYILNSDNMSNADLIELYLWCYSIIDSRAIEKVKHEK